MRIAWLVTLMAALGMSSWAVCAGPPNGDEDSINEAVRWIRSTPRIHTEYDYVMTARVRLLFFWTGRDDVGGGYVKMGEVADDPRLKVIQLLFGSDPARARGINRWGAGTEVLRLSAAGRHQRAESSAFFGFMKTSQGESAGGVESEVSAEKNNGRHAFDAIISRVDHDDAIATMVPFYSDRDFDFRQLGQATEIVMNRLGDGPRRKLRRLNGSTKHSCDRTEGFLSTVLELIDDSLAGEKAPVSLCYVYNAHEYSTTLGSVSPVPERAIHVGLRGNGKIEQTYHNLEDARFQIRNHDTGRKYNFEILVGTAGALRGVPVQISYQPNWWFQVVLNLLPLDQRNPSAQSSEFGMK